MMVNGGVPIVPPPRLQKLMSYRGVREGLPNPLSARFWSLCSVSGDAGKLRVTVQIIAVKVHEQKDQRAIFQ
jgi:hypothetical protein